MALRNFHIWRVKSYIAIFIHEYLRYSEGWGPFKSIITFAGATFFFIFFSWICLELSPLPSSENKSCVHAKMVRSPLGKQQKCSFSATFSTKENKNTIWLGDFTWAPYPLLLPPVEWSELKQRNFRGLPKYSPAFGKFLKTRCIYSRENFVF